MLNKKKSGLTLVEILITSAILSLIGVAVYSTFANGLAVWKRAKMVEDESKNIILGMEKIILNLRNSLDFSKIPFEADSGFISFAGMVENEYSQKKEIGQINYSFDAGANILYKEEKTYSQYLNEEPGRQEVAYSGLKQAEFSFCYLDNATGRYEWKDNWEKEEQDTLPWAVKLKFIFFDKDKQESELTRMVVLPVGTGRQSIELN
ncbi:MAG: prepilin-type N-terminal cleavage/methylation domain-containing protein [Candidatus Omnitrophica bacterium]|nr:prepilin-type N-terminal cleavage/methylation domain-containing protein [Candidatus Omnitrophota bacterium]MCF7876771.1 prepilin-type N-terminal cleavage/methylation domain-containing protein [Candidatus Omnitrophota bacterium]MCF7878217.1 prepilin-type N-terminal cleavage/methylation domain-containing protein [Candidatus Omnitrophota bacterium]